MNKKSSGSLTYKDAGVDIDAGKKFVDAVSRLAGSTYRDEVIKGVGGFAAAFSITPDRFKAPVLVSSTDGVGTKIKLAVKMRKHRVVGYDLVAMCVNDIITHGAEPLFFLDYISMGKLRLGVAALLVEGMVDGCKDSGCALIGGETAEMPGIYGDEDYDVAGFVVGIVEKDLIIDGSGISRDDVIIGLESNGVHSNGYSLIRKILDLKKIDLDRCFDELGCSIGEELLKPTRIYVRPVLKMLKEFRINGLAHITGGGLVDNISRVLPAQCRAVINKRGWERKPIFDLLKKLGGVEEYEMLRTFNCGVGMVVFAPAVEAEHLMRRIRELGIRPFLMGRVEERTASADPALVFED